MSALFFFFLIIKSVSVANVFGIEYTTIEGKKVVI